jgi:hypothetical protein
MGFNALLTARGFVVDNVILGNAAAFNFQKDQAIIVAGDTGNPSGTWFGSQAAADHIALGAKEIVGLGYGGGAFFDKIGLMIGTANSMFTTGGSIKPDKPSQSLFKSPYAIPMVGGTSQIYTFSPSLVDVGKPAAPPNGYTFLATDPNNTGHEPLVAQAHKQRMYVQWGFNNAPQDLSKAGADMFANVLMWRAEISASPSSGLVGSTTTAKLTGFAGKETVTLTLGGQSVGAVNPTQYGLATKTITVPLLEPGTYQLIAVGNLSGRKAITSFTVI